MCAAHYKDKMNGSRDRIAVSRSVAAPRTTSSLPDSRPAQLSVAMASVLPDNRLHLPHVGMTNTSAAPSPIQQVMSIDNNKPIQMQTEIKYTAQNMNYWTSSNNYGKIVVGKKTEALLDPWDPKSGSRTGSAPIFSLYSNGHWPALYQGHLLNANLGGQAIQENLFPVTPAFNHAHSAQVEEPVKGMFLDLFKLGGGKTSFKNDEAKRRLFYSVEAKNPNIGALKPKHLVDTEFDCHAYITEKGTTYGSGVNKDASIKPLDDTIKISANLSGKSANDALADAGWAPENHPTYRLDHANVSVNPDKSKTYGVVLPHPTNPFLNGPPVPNVTVTVPA